MKIINIKTRETENHNESFAIRMIEQGQAILPASQGTPTAAQTAPRAQRSPSTDGK